MEPVFPNGIRIVVSETIRFLSINLYQEKFVYMFSDINYPVDVPITKVYLYTFPATISKYCFDDCVKATRIFQPKIPLFVV